MHNCVAPFTSYVKLHEFGAEKPISWAKAAYFDFFTIIFILWSHILSTGEVALKAGKLSTSEGWATLYKKQNKEQEAEESD